MANLVIIASREWLNPLKESVHYILIQESYVHADKTTLQV